MVERIIAYIPIGILIVLIILYSGLPREKVVSFNQSEEGKKISKVTTIIFVIIGIIFALYVLIGFLGIIGLFFNFGAATNGGSSNELTLIPAVIWSYLLEFAAKPIGRLIEICTITVPFIIILYIRYKKIKNIK